MTIKNGERVICHSCGYTGSRSNHSPREIQDLLDRTEAGCEMPAGQCPECGALLFLRQNSYRSDDAELMRRVAAEIEDGGKDVPESLQICAEELLKRAKTIYPEN